MKRREEKRREEKRKQCHMSFAIEEKIICVKSRSVITKKKMIITEGESVSFPFFIHICTYLSSIIPFLINGKMIIYRYIHRQPTKKKRQIVIFTENGRICPNWQAFEARNA